MSEGPRRWLRCTLSLLIAGFGLFAFAASPVVAQDTGAVAGVVVDEANGETLPGANVQIKGTTTGTSTDLNGRYRLTGLEPGTVDVIFSFVGFTQKTVTGVEVEAGETTKVDVTLREQTAELDEVVIEAEAARDSEAGLLKQRAKAASVTDAISAETIGKSGSSNAADAIEKVTGVSVTDGKFVNVRGLGGRYVNTQVNGAELPSSDPNKNAVPLDLFPAGLLDNIVTNKTFTPDKPGNFTGGNVNLSTKSFPDSRTLNFSSSLTYHSEAQFDEIMRPNGGLDEVPASVPGIDEEYPSFVAPSEEERAQLDQISREFASGALTPQLDSAPTNQSYAASFGNEYTIFGDQSLGIVAGATYGRSKSAAQDRVAAQALGQNEQGVADTSFAFTGTTGTTGETLGGILNLAVKPHPNHEISLNGLYNRNEEIGAADFVGRIPRDDDDLVVRRRTVEPITRTLWTAQGRGQHLIGGGSSSPRIEWNSTYSQTEQDESDVRFFTDDFDTRGDERVYSISTSIYAAPTRYFRTLTETNWSNDLSLSVPVQLADAKGTVKVGGSYLIKDRDLDERRFTYGRLGTPNYRGDPDVYFSECAGIIEDGECDSGSYADLGLRPDLGVVISDRTQAQNNLVGERTVGAGFAMVDTQVPGLPSLRFIGGVRLERTDQSITTRDDSTGAIEETDLLPSANLVYTLRENMNVRASYTQTLARPTFREFSPAVYYDFRRQELVNGNPGLNRSLVQNVDLRWEWFVRPGELFAVSGYYKYFDEPIERVIVEQALNREVTFINQQQAQVYGVEFEARKRLDFVADALRYLEVGGNLTLTSSSVTDTTGSDLGRPLEGQSDYLINADVSYDNPEIGTTISVYYNFFDDRLDTIERQTRPDQYERGRHTVDVIASQTVMYGITVKASVKNVFNEEYEVFQSYPSADFSNIRYPMGRTVSIGLSYSL